MMRRIGAALLMLTVAACGGAPPPAAKAPSATLSQSQIEAMLAAADATRERGGYGEASEIYQEILLSDPIHAPARYGLAECLLATGKMDGANPIYDGLVGNADYHARALQGKGLALLALNQRELAEKSLTEATQADPSLWRSWNALGAVADVERQPDKASTFYARALELRPNSAMILNNLGYSKLVSHDPEGAISEFKKAIALDPESETIQNNLRLAYAAKGNYAEALRAVPRERMPAVLNNIGFMAMQRGDYAAAEGYLTRAMENSASYNGVSAKNLDELKAREAPVQ